MVRAVDSSFCNRCQSAPRRDRCILDGADQRDSDPDKEVTVVTDKQGGAFDR